MAGISKGRYEYSVELNFGQLNLWLYSTPLKQPNNNITMRNGWGIIGSHHIFRHSLDIDGLNNYPDMIRQLNSYLPRREALPLIQSSGNPLILLPAPIRRLVKAIVPIAKATIDANPLNEKRLTRIGNNNHLGDWLWRIARCEFVDPQRRPQNIRVEFKTGYKGHPEAHAHIEVQYGQGGLNYQSENFDTDPFCYKNADKNNPTYSIHSGYGGQSEYKQLTPRMIEGLRKCREVLDLFRPYGSRYSFVSQPWRPGQMPYAEPINVYDYDYQYRETVPLQLNARDLINERRDLYESIEQLKINVAENPDLINPGRE